MMSYCRLSLKLSRKPSNFICRRLIETSSFLSSSSGSDSNGDVSQLKNKFIKFNDEDAFVILDVEEEKSKKLENFESLHNQIVEEEDDIIYQRGKTGVFDIEELVELIREQKGDDLFIVSVDKELNYVNHIVIATGRSKRHIIGLGEFIRKRFKNKKQNKDIIPKIEGEDSEWIALDLGNIALHIMSSKSRKIYDLESLWAVGAKYDIKCNSGEDKLLELLKKHTISLNDLEPINK